MKSLIVTADDFGVAVEVNEAVERAHRDGVLTADSLMVAAPAAADAVRRAHALPSLRVGLHLVLVDGRPMLPAAAVPDLVDDDGFFRSNMAMAGASMFFLPKVRRQLAREIEAQFEAFAETGLPLDHVNAHKHFHLHPTIARLMVEIGKRFGMQAARVPLEPKRAIAAASGRQPLVTVDPLAPFCLSLRRRLGRAGVMTPDQVFGLSWSGTMTADRLMALVRFLPDGLSELYLHPAVSDDFPGAAPNYRHRQEFEALVDPRVATAMQAQGISLGGFADFPSHR